MPKTVAAICTPLKNSAIGVIRISGDDALSIAERVFRPADSRKCATAMAGYTAAYGQVFDANGSFDDGILTVFRAPHSYTGENVAELSLHGGEAVLKRAMRAILDCGASPAGAGEFTKRAFFNGKMSLTQAEAVMDVISAENNDALQCALNVKNGKIFERVHEISDELSYLAASAAQYIDFPEEGVQDYDFGELHAGILAAAEKLDALIAGFDEGKKIKSGIDCVIVGKPNVGKSTLMNLLTKSDRSIVTSVAGTTRDIIEETVELDGVALRLSDTAGIRESSDEVESIGIERTRQRMAAAQLILAVFSADEPLSENDFSLLEAIQPLPHVIILNKTDLNAGAVSLILERYGKPIPMSAKTGEGFDELKAAILSAVGRHRISADSVYLANERQLETARRARACLGDALGALELGITVDAVGVSLESAIGALLSLTGERASEAVISQVFEKFCVGK